MFSLLLLLSSFTTFTHSTTATTTTTTPTPLYIATIVKAWPHSHTAFTEGFGFITRDLLGQSSRLLVYESTGLYTNQAPTIQLLDYRTNTVVLHRDLPRGLFAEGSTLVGGVLFLATLSSSTVYMYEATTLKPLPTEGKNIIKLPSEGPLHGWGLTTDPETGLMYVSDGSSELQVISISSSGTMRHVESISVHDGDTPIRELNELEWVDGLIYANVLGQSCVCKILPETGDVVGWISFENAFKKYPLIGKDNLLLRQMNGIAYDSYSKVLLVTGKLWPFTFEIQEGEPIVEGSRTGEMLSDCRPSRVIDYKHGQVGINNKLPFIEFPTAEKLRKNFLGRR